MGKFFNKKKAVESKPEDFVLFKPEKEKDLDKTTAMDVISDSMLSSKDNSQHTVSIDSNEINAQLNKKRRPRKQRTAPGRAPVVAPPVAPLKPGRSPIAPPKPGQPPVAPPKPGQPPVAPPKPGQPPVNAPKAVKPVNPVAKKKVKRNKPSDKKSGFFGKYRILTICICTVLIAALITGAAFGIIILSNPLYGYAQTATEKGSIMRTLDVQGTIVSGEKYEITSLVSGKIVASDFEVGDTVEEGDVLYKIDDSEAQLAVDKAENEVARAKDESANPSTPTSYRIVASEAGTVGTVSIKEGSTVTPGAQIGTIQKADGSMAAITSYVSGTVTAVSVRAGQSLSAGQIVATVSPASAQKKNTTYDKKSSEIDLKSAQQHLENFSITSPVSGVVVEKHTKVGDNVGITDTTKPMMIILDTSHLDFKFSVDEHKIRDIKVGQSVSLSTETIPDTDFSGEILSIASEGVIGDDGKPMYDIIASIDDPGELRSGMSVSGTVVLKTKKDVISLPENALMESDGRNALVFVKTPEDESDDEDVSEELTNELNYPWIKVPRGCKLVSVKYGLSDGSKVQILSGVKLGDIVVYDPDNESTLVPSTLPEDEMDDMEFDEDFDLDLDIDEDEIDPDDYETDEELRRAIQKQISHLETTL